MVSTAVANLTVESKAYNIVFSYHADGDPAAYIGFGWTKISATQVEFSVLQGSLPALHFPVTLDGADLVLFSWSSL